MPSPIKPSALPRITTLNEPLNASAIVIVEASGHVLKLTLAEIITYLLVTRFGRSEWPLSLVDTLPDTLVTLAGEVADKSPILHTHTPASVGLGNVANLAPADLPISLAVQEALDDKYTESNLPTITSVDRLILDQPPSW